MVEWLEFTGYFFLAVLKITGGTVVSLIALYLVCLLLAYIPVACKWFWKNVVPKPFKKDWVIALTIAFLLFFTLYIVCGIFYIGRNY